MAPLTAQAATMAQHAWHLVWCHEHCFKANYHEEASQLARLSGECLGKLICAKHATKLKHHFAKHNNCRPWILIVDFRGLVPCMNLMRNAAFNQSLFNPPALIVAVCQKPGQMVKASSRASQWDHMCQWMHNKSSVLVTMHSPSEILQDLKDRMPKQAGPFGMLQMLSSNCLVQNGLTCIGNVHGVTDKQDHAALDNSDTFSNCSNSSTEPDACTGNEQRDVVPFRRMPSPAGLYIQGLLLNMDPKDLKCLLQEATPRCYED